MRVAVYNRHWSTGGGGERFGGAIAEVLARSDDVDLLAEERVDFDWLEERLGLDLSATRPRLLESPAGSAADASREYDLFFNVSYLSGVVNQALRGIYVVHFPGALSCGDLERRWSSRRLRWRHLERTPARVTLGHGFHGREGGRAGVSWTNGDAVLHVMAPPGAADEIELVFAHMRPPTMGPAAVRIIVDREPVVDQVLDRVTGANGRARTTVRVPVAARADGRLLELRILSDAFRPVDVTDSDDSRLLGVPLAEVRVGRANGGRRPPSMRHVRMSSPVAFLHSYDAVVANSEFTSSWVARRWGVRSRVLHPPGRRCEPGTKRPIILAVGRFFGAEHGHSKKQLEMVQAFRRLCERGLTGWTLHLAGGCKEQDRAYVELVRRGAADLPVVFHVDASGAEIEDLFATASIYWHATGLGENANRHPERLEHFGISAIEAMSAGAIPIVLNKGGPLEVVRHGVDGFHFASVRELVRRTEELIADGALRSRLRVAAVQRVDDLSARQFSDRLLTIVDEVFDAPPTVRPA